jgi:NADH:ubiquinone oxidoreductase subunit H
MEPVLFSLLLIPTLAALVSVVSAAERAATEFMQNGRMPKLSTQQNPVRRWTRELWRHFDDLSRLGENRDIPKALGYVICCLTAILGFAVMPVAPPFDVASDATMIAPAVDVGVLFVLAMFGLSVVGKVLASCGSRSRDLAVGRWIVLAACGLAVLGIARSSGTWRLDVIVNEQEQTGVWWLAQQPLGFAAMLLCLVWMICGITAPQLGIPSAEVVGPEGDRRPGCGPFQIADHLQLIAASYLFVELFFGGWHVWGIDAAPSSNGWHTLRWTVRFLALHLKVLALLLWLVWLRFVRLPAAQTDVWRIRLAVAALVAAALNFIVTECAEQYLASQPLVWKAAVGWLVLTIGLAILATFTKQLMPE